MIPEGLLTAKSPVSGTCFGVLVFVALVMEEVESFEDKAMRDLDTMITTKRKARNKREKTESWWPKRFLFDQRWTTVTAVGLDPREIDPREQRRRLDALATIDNGRSTPHLDPEALEEEEAKAPTPFRLRSATSARICARSNLGGPHLAFNADGARSNGTAGARLGDVDAELEGEGRYDTDDVGDRLLLLSFLLMAIDRSVRLDCRGGGCGDDGDAGGEIIPDDLPTLVLPLVKTLFWFIFSRDWNR